MVYYSNINLSEKDSQMSFSFTLPDSLYELTGDIDDSSMPVEFFRTKGALRGEIRFQEVNSTTLAEFARTEMHSRRKSNSKNIYNR